MVSSLNYSKPSKEMKGPFPPTHFPFPLLNFPLLFSIFFSSLCTPISHLLSYPSPLSFILSLLSPLLSSPLLSYSPFPPFLSSSHSSVVFSSFPFPFPLLPCFSPPSTPPPFPLLPSPPLILRPQMSTRLFREGSEMTE